MIWLLLALLVLAILILPGVWVQHVLKKHSAPRNDYPGNGGDMARHLLAKLELHDVQVEKANYGGSLYAVGRKKVANSSHNYVSNSNNLSINLETFSSKAEKTISSIRSHILESYKSHKKIGFYVPLRALPYVCNLPPNIQFRFFDDTPHWYGKKFDGMNVAIENMNDLITDPVDVVYVMSLTFGDVIRNKINSNLSSDIETYILGDFCE